MDIDIDLASTFDPKDLFKDKVTHASMVEDGELKKHLVGVHFQNVPKDADSGLAAIPYNKIEDLGYFKIDLLPLTLLNNFENKDEIRYLLNIEPDWSMLEDESVVKQLFHIKNHFDLVYQVRPKCIEDLSDVLALIRPSKAPLLNKYLRNREAVRPELHTKREKGDLRRSHSIPYAMLIVLHMHLLKIKLEK